MNNRIAILAIVVEDSSVSGEVNALLHEYSNVIIGRMGLPRPEENLSIITIVLECADAALNMLCEKLKLLPYVRVESMIAK